MGFIFATDTAIAVTGLGYYDYLGDGFATPHEVGIFDSGGNLLVSTSLVAGAVNPLEGGFRYQSIAPYALAAGESYILAATTNGPCDPWAYGHVGTAMTGFALDPSISIDPYAALFNYQSDDVLVSPRNHYSDYTIYAGPNLQIGSPVPEPATAVFVLAPLTLLAFLRPGRAHSQR